MNIRFLISRAGLLLKKYSPEILTGVGLVAEAAGTVLACKATYHLDEVVAEDNDRIQKVEDAHNGLIELKEGAVYSDEAYKRDLTKLKTQRAMHVAKHYLPAGLCLVGGGASILAGHGILRHRNTVTTAALASMTEAYRMYRENVEKLGNMPNGAEILRLGGISTEEKVEETDENGEVKEVWKDKIVWDHLNNCIEADPQTMIFSHETCPDVFTGNFIQDWTYLKGRQAELTNTLRIRGHLFKNDVARSVGHRDTDDGAILGWVSYGEGDNYVDFGIADPEHDDTPSRYVMDYAAQHEGAIPLSLNFDGVIIGSLKRRGNSN